MHGEMTVENEAKEPKANDAGSGRVDLLIRLPTSEDRAEIKERRFGRCIVRTWKRTDGNWHQFPWQFSVQEDGKSEHTFTGVPNYCETRHRALMRGWWRSKWINNGTWGEHYKAVPAMPLPGADKVI